MRLERSAAINFWLIIWSNCVYRVIFNSYSVLLVPVLVVLCLKITSLTSCLN